MIISAGEAATRAKNTAHIRSIGRRVPVSLNLPLFTNVENVSWNIQLCLAEQTYPLATIQMSIGRKGFELKPGALFLFSSAFYNIEEMVLRLLTIEEEPLDSERLIIKAKQDVNYVAGIPGVIGSVGQSTGISSLLAVPDAMDYFNVVEPPYINVETPGAIIPMPVRVNGNETGALIYLSIDSGTSYSLMGTATHFSVHGVLTSALAAGGDTFTVEIAVDASRLSSDSNAHNKMTNLILIGSEVISFATIAPVSGDEYIISGLSRGLYDTIDDDHAIDDEMFSLDGLDRVSSSMMAPGNTYYFKAVPFNAVSSGDISEATAVAIDYIDRSRCPRPVEDLAANGASTSATYTNDIALTWDSQVRGSDETPTSFLTCDGLFEVQVWVSDVNVRTAQTTDGDTFFNSWTYTEAMNLADNTSLASSVVFKVYSFLDSTHYSEAVEITVTLV